MAPMQGGDRRIAAVLFDKDGTLFDFRRTWAGWTAELLRDLAEGDESRAGHLGRVIGFDLATRDFAPESPVIAGTAGIVTDLLAPHLPGLGAAGLEARMNASAAHVPLAEAVPLKPYLGGLRARGLRLGVATNDGEAPARAQLTRLEIAEAFHFIAGYDSGHGAKPEPGMLLAFARSQRLHPAQVVMVGDSCHDLAAGRAAGMTTVGVLTGIAGSAELAPLADIVLPDIGHLPALLTGA